MEIGHDIPAASSGTRMRASAPHGWELDDVISSDDKLDFNLPLLPEALAGTAGLDFLSADERLTLNHIRANAYLHTFELLQSFILPFVLDHARPRLRGDFARARALLQFASAEAKHIELFRRFRNSFSADFGHSCALFAHAGEWSHAVLSHHPLAVALIALQSGWMTEQHDAARANGRQKIDSLFGSLLELHWLEEASHVQLDTDMVVSIATRCGDEADTAMAEYRDIVAMLDDVLRAQVELDLETLTRVTGIRLTSLQRDQFVTLQHQASRWTFLGSGMTHPEFLSALEQIAPASRPAVEQLALTFVQ
jgi:hypothetical protein